MNVEQLAQIFWRDGYLILEDFFAPEQMDEIQDRNMRYQFSTNTLLVDRQQDLTP